LAGCDRPNTEETASGDGAPGTKQPVNRRAIEADSTAERSRLGQSLRAAEAERLRRPQTPERWPQYREWTMREVSIDALSRIGTAAIPALVDALQNPDPLLRRHAAQA